IVDPLDPRGEDAWLEAGIVEQVIHEQLTLAGDGVGLGEDFPECRQLRSALGAPQTTLDTRIILPYCSANVSVPVKACPATCCATLVERNGGRHSNCPDLDQSHLLPCAEAGASPLTA